MPEGHNNMFKPVISDFDPVNYDFTIFNRWGQSIFQTNDPNEAWTGEVPNGGMAATGTYLYMVTVTSGEGIEIVRRGHVTLLK